MKTYRRRRATLTVAVMVFSALFATAAGAEPPTVGFKLGTVGATIAPTDSDAVETSMRFGGAAGGFVNLPVHRNLVLVPDVLFTSRRFAGREGATDFTVTSRAVELTLLAQVRWETAGRVRPLLSVGPQFAFISSASQTVAGVTRDVSDLAESTDTGIAFGGGCEILAGHGAMVIDVRYVLGLQNINKDPSSAAKARALLLLFGYRF